MRGSSKWCIDVIPFVYAVHDVFLLSLFIVTASETCCSIASFLNSPVTDIHYSGIRPSCFSLLCFQRTELSSFLARDAKCARDANLFYQPFPIVGTPIPVFQHYCATLLGLTLSVNESGLDSG